MFELKPLTKEGIPGALARGERYRLLNEPAQAESIYLDVLEVESENHEALVGLLLAITDQFGEGRTDAVQQARDVLPRFKDEYDRAYYAGIICERRGRAQLKQGAPGAGAVAYQWFAEAKGWYEQAEAIRPPGNDDVLLRWNACARLMQRHRQLAPAPDDRYEPYRD